MVVVNKLATLDYKSDCMYLHRSLKVHIQFLGVRKGIVGAYVSNIRTPIQASVLLLIIWASLSLA